MALINVGKIVSGNIQYAHSASSVHFDEKNFTRKVLQLCVGSNNCVFTN